MLQLCTVGLKPSIRILGLEGQGPVALEEPGHRRLRLAAPKADQRGFLKDLVRGDRTAAALGQVPGGPGGRLDNQALFERFEKLGWLCYSLWLAERVAVTLEPLTPEFQVRPMALAGPFRLTRFAWLRRHEEGGILLESPLGFGRVRIRQPTLLGLVGLLGEPASAQSLARELALPLAWGEAFLAMLLVSGAVFPCTSEGRLREDQDPVLRLWEFHDLLFHTRSRKGRHGNPAGKTAPGPGAILPAPPAVKAPGTGPRTPLPEPVPGGGAPFFDVLDARRSRRLPGKTPVTLEQLSAFLHHVARVRDVAPADPTHPGSYDATTRPCASGGALHPLEVYLTVSRCLGLEPGFYHYAPATHTLERLGDLKGDAQRLVTFGQG